MNPPLRSPDLVRAPARQVRRPGDPRSVVAYCLVVGLVPSIIGLLVARSGAPWPAVGAVLVLAVLMALAVNRCVFFSTELVATAEVAVLLAAIVGFRGDAALLGPWVIGLLAGPLDGVHWQQRAFHRMAYNAGNRSAAALAGAAVLAATDSALGVPLAVLAATVVVVLVDGAIALALAGIRRHGGWREIVRAEVVGDSLGIPLGLVGALAGFAATAVGWWAAAAIVAPLAFVPELALVRARRWRWVGAESVRASAVRHRAQAIGAVAGERSPAARPSQAVVLGVLLFAAVLLVATASITPNAILPVVAVVLAVLVALDVRVARASPVPFPFVLPTAAVVVVFDVAAAVMAEVALALLMLGILLARDRRDELARVAWSAPLVCTWWLLAGSARRALPWSALAFGIGALLVAALGARAAPLTWRSRGARVLLRPVRAVPLRGRWVACAALGLAGAAAVALRPTDGVVIAALTMTAGACAMVASTSREWTYAPRRRAWVLGVVIAWSGIASLATFVHPLVGLVLLAPTTVVVATGIGDLGRRRGRPRASDV